MDELEFKTQEQVMNDIRSELESAGYNVTDWEPGSRNRTRWEIVSRVARGLWWMLEQVLQLFFISSQKMAGMYLEWRVSERGITRKPGAKSKGRVRLSRSTPSPIFITVPKGTEFITTDRKVKVVTLEEAFIPIGGTFADVQVEASEVGRIGDLSDGVELKEAGISIAGLETITVFGGLSGGVDRETDEELRARYLEEIRNPDRGGAPSDYEKWAKQVNGVHLARCLPLARGPGTVDVLIAMETGLPTQELINEVAAYIQERRPVGADVRIISPSPVVINVAGTIYLAEGFDFAAVHAATAEAIRDYIQTLGIGGTIRPTHIGKVILSVEGVRDYELSEPAENHYLASDEMATVGTITFVQGSEN